MQTSSSPISPARSFYERQYESGEEIPRSNKLIALGCVPTDRPLSVLDVGCGTGVNSDYLVSAGHRVVGVDIAQSAIEKYRSRGFEGFQADLDGKLPFSDASFDVVFCSEVLEHTVDPDHAASELRRVLRPSGIAVITTPNSAFWAYRVLGLAGRTVGDLQHPKHLHFFSRRRLLRLLREAGFEVRRSFGRNMYVLFPTPPWGLLKHLLTRFGFQEERRFATDSTFLQLSHSSAFWNTLFADTLIVVAERR